MSDTAPWEDFQSVAAQPTPVPQSTQGGPWSDFKPTGDGSSPTITQPPEPQGTTLLSDKNLVVGHPMSMSHDQVNDAIQTGIYNRPKNDFHDDAPLIKDLHLLAPETAKAGIRGVENIGKGFAGLAKWVGAAMEWPGVDADGKPLPANQDAFNTLVQNAGKGLEDISDRATSYLNKRQQSGFEAPNPDVFRGSFVSNPSFTRLAADVAQGAPSLAAASALTIATGNPLVGAASLGLVGAGEQYETSKEEGVSNTRASVAAAASGIGNTLLMSLPLGHALEGFGSTVVKSAAKGAAEFAGISGVMTPFNNIVAKIGGDKARPLFEGMAESILSGAVSGGILGGFTPNRGAEIDSMIADAHQSGVPAKDIDAARAAIATQMKENPEAVQGAINQSKVYTDIKDQLSAVEKPESMTPEAWQSHNEESAKLWSSHVASEAEKRGETIDQAYDRMRPTIQGDAEARAGDLLQTYKRPATFIGYQETGEPNEPPIPLYNIPKGFPNAGSTVDVSTLKEAGITVPEIPTFEDWKKNPEKYRDNPTYLQRHPEAPALEEKALQSFGETKDLAKAGFILPDGRAVDFTKGGDAKLFMHQDVSEIYKGSGTIDDPTGLLHDFMQKTGAVRLSDYDDVGGKHLSIEAHGPLSQEQLRNLGEYIDSGKLDSVTFETVDPTGRTLRAKSYDQPTGEDLARFFNGSSTYFQSKVDPTFFSQVARTIDEKMPAKAPGDQLMGLLKNAPGIKNEELEWIGLDDFLKDKKSVTKEEVQKFIANNNVQVQEVMKGEATALSPEQERKLEELSDKEETEGLTDSESLSMNHLIQIRNAKESIGMTGEPTKFSKYTLPGGENYRELLLTLPEMKEPPTEKWEIVDSDGSRAFLADSESEAKHEVAAYIKRYGRKFEMRPVQFSESSSQNFQSAHFSEPNILAHIRFNDRVDAEGNKTLFIEEIQSDWHQKGKKEGYAVPKNPKVEDAKGFFGIANDTWNKLTDEQKQSYFEEMTSGESHVKGGVPNAPFKKTWHELSMKRMLRFAAENGYDKIAWTTGEQQAGRYDLSKQIDSIRYVKSGENYEVNATGKDGQDIPLGENIKASDLSNIVGKDVADKIISGQGDDYFKKHPKSMGIEGMKELSGVDLKVGGEGMKGFYDKILPDFLNKYAKKWGGKVGETQFSIPDNESFKKGVWTDDLKENAHSLDITPSMKESVMQGQPLFQGPETGPRGATSFTPEKTVIKLFKNADASTFLHESAHAWLQDIHDFVQSGKADEKYMADWKTLGDWLGVKEGAKRLTTEQHEQFARGFEAYARNGVAPTPQLQGAFDKFKDWLSKIYRSAQDLKVEIPDNVRGVLDGMFKGETPDTANNVYVKNRPFDIELGSNDKSTSQTLREQFSGIKNEQIVRGNQLADEVKQMVPNKAEREGMFWYKAAQGDMNILADALDDPKLKDYHDQILRAMQLSPKAIEALGKVNQYYEEGGRVSQEVGTIKTLRENYQNRIYAPDKPEDFVKTETKAGIKQSTKHSLRRVFDTEFEAAQAGKKFATTDVADALAIHNEELARVNTARKLAESMAEAGLGAWKKEQPDGWEQVGTLEKNVPIKDKEGNAVIGEDGNQAVSRSKFYAPEGIADGLKAIADPNFAKKIDSVRNLQRYQGLVKTVDLSFSFFHHFSMAMQSLYQGGIRSLMSLPRLQAHLDSPEFKEIERDFVQHTGMTAKVEANQDILRNLVQHEEDTFSRVSNLPGVKTILESAQKSSEFLFGKLQRFLKVSDYGEKISNWVAKHPDATNAEVKAAKLGFSKQINAVYGGLNWEAIGMTKSNLSLLRLGLLAPDWTISNVQLLKFALGDSGVAGKASRAHILTALVSGMMLTEGLNKMLTGHFTDENPHGHKLEVEISPNVYVSFLRGGIGDITKFASMVQESGLQGVSRFMQGKLAPFPRTAIGLLTNTQYTGRPIGKKSEGPVANSYDVLKYLLSSLAPLPLGLSNFLQMTKDNKITPQGAAAVLTGVGRYSKSGGSSSKLKM